MRGQGLVWRRAGRALTVAAGLVACALLLARAAEAAPAYPVVKILVQPDGAGIAARLWGDEFVHGWETAAGRFTLVRNEATGYWEYAVRDTAGNLAPSGVVAGAGAPPVAGGLRPTRAFVNSARAARGAPALGVPTRAAPPPWAGVGTRVLFIMVEFTDRQCTFTPAQMQANLFGGTASGPGNLAEFFSEISYGRLQLQGTVVGNAAGTDCAALGNTHAFYDTGAGSAAGLVAEAVGLVTGHVNFAQFDNDGDGTVDALGLVYAGGGPHDGCDTDDAPGGSGGDDLWPHSGSTGGTATGDGVNVNPYIINSEITFGVNPASACNRIQTIGLFAHEFGHSLGLPDLYDTDSSSYGVGRWSTMASQYSSTVNLADTPAHYDPWSKWFLNWITPADYTGQDVGISLDRVEDSGKVAQFLANPGGAESGGTGEYFLVENRQRVGFDAALPGCGILIWHLDDSRTNNTLEGHTAANHRLVDLERADGGIAPADDGTQDSQRVPFPGSTNNSLFSDTTTPTANLYSGDPSGVRVSIPGGASACADSMPVNFGNPEADLSISKSDSPDPVTPGELLNYIVTVTNSGPGVASNVIVTDTLPTGVVYLSNSDSCVNASGTLTCNLGTIPSGVSRGFTIQVRVPANFLSSIPAGTANLTNTARVTANEPDGDLADNSVTISTVVIDSADLRLTKECKPDQPNRAPAGTETYCEIYVDNLGPSDARSVVITDRIISTTPITITAITVTGAGLTCPATPIGPTSDTTITCTDAVLPAGGRDTIRVTFRANDAGDVDDIASVTSATPDPDTSNNLARGRVSFGSAADLSLSKTGPPTAIAGANLTYNLQVTNTGPSTAVNVVVTDSLPAQVSFVSAVPSAGGSCQAGVVPGDPSKPLRCNFGTLASGGIVSLAVTVKVNSNVPGNTIIVNNADTHSDVFDPDTSDNVKTAPVTIDTRADLSITKTADAATYKPSSTITYQITAVNNGESKALHVVVTDNLPEFRQALYRSDTGGCTLSTPITLTCNLGDLEVGQSKTFFVSVTVKGSRGTVSNTASVAATGPMTLPDPVAANNSSTVNVIVKGGS